METTINQDLVEQITTLVQAWNTADRRVREMLHGWEQRATRAGLERGFYVQVGQLSGACAVVGIDEMDTEEAGRVVYAAYMRGGVTAAMDVIA